MGGCEGPVYLKWASHFGISIQNFICPSRKLYLGLGGLVDPPDQPPPPPFVDNHVCHEYVICRQEIRGCSSCDPATPDMERLGQAHVCLLTAARGRRQTFSAARAGPKPLGVVLGALRDRAVPRG